MLVVMKIGKQVYTEHKAVYPIRPKYVHDTEHLCEQIVEWYFPRTKLRLRSKLWTMYVLERISSRMRFKLAPIILSGNFGI